MMNSKTAAGRLAASRPLIAALIALVAATTTASAQERTRGDFDPDGVRIH